MVFGGMLQGSARNPVAHWIPPKECGFLTGDGQLGSEMFGLTGVSAFVWRLSDLEQKALHKIAIIDLNIFELWVLVCFAKAAEHELKFAR